jgi:hypothetical protein
MTDVIMMQFLPFADRKALAVYDTFERDVYRLADAPIRAEMRERPLREG